MAMVQERYQNIYITALFQYCHFKRSYSQDICTQTREFSITSSAVLVIMMMNEER